MISQPQVGHQGSPSPQDKETTVRTPGEIILLVDFQEQESDHIPETMTNVMGC